MSEQALLSEKAVEMLSDLEYRPDAAWSVWYLPLGSILWEDELPKSLHRDFFDQPEQMNLISTMFAVRIKIWDNEPLSPQDEKLWDDIQRQVPTWPLFRRLLLTPEQAQARKEAEEAVEREFREAKVSVDEDDNTSKTKPEPAASSLLARFKHLVSRILTLWTSNSP